MLTPTEITAGTARLVGGKLKPEDVGALTSVFHMVFAGLIEDSSYDFETDLTALDDTSDTSKKAAQVAGALIKMEGIGFTGGTLRGGRGGLEYSQEAEYNRLVLFAFSKLYPIPKEFSIFDTKRARYFGARRVSQSVSTPRVEDFDMDRGSEAWRRRNRL